MSDPSLAPVARARVVRGIVPAVTAGVARSRTTFARVGTLRVKLTIAVALLSAAGLAAGGALVVRAVETTVVRAIEDGSRAELHVIGGQIAHGVPLSAIRTTAPGRRLRFVRADGTKVETQPFDEPGPGVPPPRYFSGPGPHPDTALPPPEPAPHPDTALPDPDPGPYPDTALPPPGPAPYPDIAPSPPRPAPYPA